MLLDTPYFLTFPTCEEQYFKKWVTKNWGAGPPQIHPDYIDTPRLYRYTQTIQIHPDYTNTTRLIHLGIVSVDNVYQGEGSNLFM